MTKTMVNPESVAEEAEEMPLAPDCGRIDEKYHPPYLEALMRGTTGAVLGPAYDWIADGQDYCA